MGSELRGERIEFDLYQSCGNMGSVGRVSVFSCGDVGGVGGSGARARVWKGGVVLSVCILSLDYLCKWKVQVSVYCARQIPAHLRCTQCPILLHYSI